MGFFALGILSLILVNIAYKLQNTVKSGCFYYFSIEKKYML